MTSKLITGAEWLDKLNLDILYHICWFLDVKSIVRLALVSPFSADDQSATPNTSVYRRVKCLTISLWGVDSCGFVPFKLLQLNTPPRTLSTTLRRHLKSGELQRDIVVFNPRCRPQPSRQACVW